MSTPRKNKSLTLMVYEQLMELMVNYELVPGQRLVFADLATQLNVSRTPVNNALGILAREGYLDFVPNQGYSVHNITRKEAEDLYEIRNVLEIGFLGHAMRNMTDEALQQIEESKYAYEQGVDREVTRKHFVLDTEFHLAIMKVADNAYLMRLYEELSRKIFFRFRIEDLLIGRVDEIISEHEMLFEALVNRDLELAKERIKAHHDSSRKYLFPRIFRGE